MLRGVLGRSIVEHGATFAERCCCNPMVCLPRVRLILVLQVCDFPAEWPQLLPYMIEQFKLQDFNVINGVLQTAETLFDRYRGEYECDTVNRELRHILDTTFSALMELFTGLVELTKTTTDIPTLKSLFHSLVLLSRIFYDLNYVTIPEEFEDNMATWFGGFHHLLSLPLIPALASDDDDRPGVMEELKTEIVQAVSYGNFDNGFDHFPYNSAQTAPTRSMI